MALFLSILSKKTMKSLILYPSLALILFAGSCGSSKETTTSETKPTPVKAEKPVAENPNVISSTTVPPQEEVVMTATQKQSENMYRFIVSFISIGEGTDRTARPILDGIVTAWETKLGKSISVESIPWGREGENDFCYSLKELTPKEQETFVKEVRTAFKDHSLIQITENQACAHKR